MGRSNDVQDNVAGIDNLGSEEYQYQEAAYLEQNAVDDVVDEAIREIDFAFTTAQQKMVEMGQGFRTLEGYARAAMGFFRLDSARQGAVSAYQQSGRHPLGAGPVQVSREAALETLQRGERVVDHRVGLRQAELGGASLAYLQMPCCQEVMGFQEVAAGEMGETHVVECVGCQEQWFVRMEYEKATLKDSTGHTVSIPLRSE